MNLLFYPRFAWSGIVKNRRLFLPFVIVSVINSSMLYIMTSLLFHSELSKCKGAASLYSTLELGAIVISFFSVIFLIYANSFLIKQRSKEIGLFSVLGMGKINIAGVLFFEFLITSVGSVLAGLAFGVAFSRLVYMLLSKMIRQGTFLSFEISVKALILTASVFLGILFVSFLFHLLRISVSRPIELIAGSSVGEKEPRTKWLLVVIGIATLSAGYIIANVQEKPLAVLRLFFLAVLLVIVGTYCLFTAGSIAVLKFLKKRKNFYYRPENFTSISGLIYRMKQNSIGLASICILSTMTLLTVSTTASMYAGVEDAFTSHYENDIRIECTGVRPEKSEEFRQLVQSVVSENAMTAKNEKLVTYVSGLFSRNGNMFTFQSRDATYMPELDFFTLMGITEFNNTSEVDIEINPGQAVVFANINFNEGSIILGTQNYSVLKSDGVSSPFDLSRDIVNSYLVVLSDADFEKQLIDNGFGPGREMDYMFDVDVDDQTVINLTTAIQEKLTANPIQDISAEGIAAEFYVGCAASGKDAFFSLNGGILFIGIFLGIVFLMGTVMIIYYKQISEGYGDRVRFQVMRKVGMSDPEIRKTIGRQILLVFFLPLVTSFIHMVFAFRFMTQILNVMYFFNTGLFVTTTLISAAVFALAYAVVYKLTARTYYHIVR